jgi:hypothetical protein
MYKNSVNGLQGAKGQMKLAVSLGLSVCDPKFGAKYEAGGIDFN